MSELKHIVANATAAEMAVVTENAPRSSEQVHGLDRERKRRLIAAVAERIVAHVDELTALDAAIGDGDHGYNMKRGFEAVLQDLDALSAMSLPDLLKAVGMKLVMKVGGASGPLYGTLFLALGKELPPAPSRAQVAIAFEAAIAAVCARGKSGLGKRRCSTFSFLRNARSLRGATRPMSRRRRSRPLRPLPRCAPRVAAPRFSANARSAMSTRAPDLRH